IAESSRSFASGDQGDRDSAPHRDWCGGGNPNLLFTPGGKGLGRELICPGHLTGASSRGRGRSTCTRFLSQPLSQGVVEWSRLVVRAWGPLDRGARAKARGSALSVPHRPSGGPRRRKSMNVRPLADRILVRRIEEKETMRGGIIIPDTAKEKPQEGEVVAIGPGRMTEDGKRIAMEGKKGDRILIGKYSGTDVKIDGTEYTILREDDVLGVLATEK